MRKIVIAAMFAACLGSPSLVLAQEAPMVSGTVKGVDEASQKITLDHGAIPNLGMDPMEMAWRVQDPAMLKGLKTGDKVQFTADRVDGSLAVTKIQKTKCFQCVFFTAWPLSLRVFMQVNY